MLNEQFADDGRGHGGGGHDAMDTIAMPGATVAHFDVEGHGAEGVSGDKRRSGGARRGAKLCCVGRGPLLWQFFSILSALWLATSAVRTLLLAAAVHRLVPINLVFLPFAADGLMVWLAGCIVLLSQWSLAGTLVFALLGAAEAFLALAMHGVVQDQVSDFVTEPDHTINTYMTGVWAAVQTGGTLTFLSAGLAGAAVAVGIVAAARDRCGSSRASATATASARRGDGRGRADSARRRRLMRSGANPCAVTVPCFGTCCMPCLWRCCCCFSLSDDADAAGAGHPARRGGRGGSGAPHGDSAGLIGGDADAYIAHHEDDDEDDADDDDDGFGDVSAADGSRSAASQPTRYHFACGGLVPSGCCRRARLHPVRTTAIVVWWLAFVAIAAALGVGLSALSAATRERPDDLPAGDKCDPLVPSGCALPFPSAYYLRDDATTGTGYRVDFGLSTLPMTRVGRLDPAAWNEADGFSTAAPMLFAFDSPVYAADLIPYWQIDQHMWDNATTVLVEVETGRRHPHWTEVDAFDVATASGYPQDEPPLLILQPAEPLKHNTRYAVGVRGLRYADNPAGLGTPGDPVQRSPAFAGIVDGTDTSDRARRFRAEVLPALAAAGPLFAAGDLQLAWDFVTVSKNNSVGRMQAMRDDALSAVGPNGPAYTIDHVNPGDCSADDQFVGRWVWGHFLAPNYMQQAAPGLSFLTRSADTSKDRGGRPIPVANGEVRVNFLLLVPCSLVSASAGGTGDVGAKASRLVQVGHGLFGDRGELHQHWFSEIADRYKWVLVATDWEGMSFVDVPVALKIFVDSFASFAAVPERSAQGFVNKAISLRLMLGRMTSDASVSEDGTDSGAPLIDPATTKAVYYGNSQGSILGGGYFGFSTDLDKAALGETGAVYALILTRSADFTIYHDVLRLQIYGQRDLRLGLVLAQQLWDSAESAGWLRLVNQEPPADSPQQKRVLLQAAKGDAQVSWIAAHVQARAYQCSTVAPQLRPVFGVSERQPPFNDGSVIVEYEFGGVPPIPRTNTPPDKRTDTHECVPRTRWAQDQLRGFFEEGEVQNFCGGDGQGDVGHGMCVVERCPWDRWGESDD